MWAGRAKGCQAEPGRGSRASYSWAQEAVTMLREREVLGDHPQCPAGPHASQKAQQGGRQETMMVTTGGGREVQIAEGAGWLAGSSTTCSRYESRAGQHQESGRQEKTRGIKAISCGR